VLYDVIDDVAEKTWLKTFRKIPPRPQSGGIVMKIRRKNDLIAVEPRTSFAPVIITKPLQAWLQVKLGRKNEW